MALRFSEKDLSFNRLSTQQGYDRARIMCHDLKPSSLNGHLENTTKKAKSVLTFISTLRFPT